MDFGKAFTYIFDDPDWVRKVILPALIALIPILGQLFVIGWTMDIMQRVIRRDPTPLPELDFGRQLMLGLRAFVIGLVYSIPILILLLPLIIISINIDNSQVNADTANTSIILLSICCGGLMVLYSLAMYYILPAAYAKSVVRDELGPAFRLREVLDLVRAAPGAYLLVLIGSLLVGALIAPLGSILCGVGAVLTYTYAMAVTGHLYGQAYLEGNQNLELNSTLSSAGSL